MVTILGEVEAFSTSYIVVSDRKDTEGIVVELLELGTKVHFTYLTGDILQGEICGRRYKTIDITEEVNKLYDDAAGPSTEVQIESYCVAQRHPEGYIVDWRWLGPSNVRSVELKESNGDSQPST